MSNPMTGSGTRVRLAVIGLGERVTHMARLLSDVDPDVRVVAVADPQPEAAARRAAAAGLPDADAIRYFGDVEALLARAGDFDALLIGTPCHLHAPLAVAVAGTGLPLFLEKPVAVSWDQLAALAAAYAGRPHAGRRLVPPPPHGPRPHGRRDPPVRPARDRQPGPGRQQRPLRRRLLRPVVPRLRPHRRPVAAEGHPRPGLRQLPHGRRRRARPRRPAGRRGGHARPHGLRRPARPRPPLLPVRGDRDLRREPGQPHPPGHRRRHPELRDADASPPTTPAPSAGAS